MCFSGSSSSIYKEWSADMLYSLALCWVQIGHAASVSRNGEKSRRNKKSLPRECSDERKIYLILHFICFLIYFSFSTLLTFDHLDLVKLFGSRSRVKLLEKLVIEDTVAKNGTGFFIRELCRDTDEQINAVRRELMNLEHLGILKSYEQNKKKFYTMNRNCPIYEQIRDMYLKSYNVMIPIKEFFK
jgi:glutaredoxin-related protein